MRPACLLLAVCASCFPQAPQYPGYKLVWADEFNNNGPPDAANWIHETGFVRNLEDQYYQPENAWCENGMLIIEARREKRSNPGHAEGSSDWRKSRKEANYTASSIQTRGKHEWLYGRFEMRARIPVERGHWPAWWTLGSARPWPGSGEIDIMEYYRGILLANLIWHGGDDTTRVPLSDLGGAEWAREFHVWRMDWDHDRVRIHVDDRVLKDVSIAGFDNRAGGANAFREPHYMLLNFAIGGTQGTRDASKGLADPSETKFPARLEVDYVRVYQRVN